MAKISKISASREKLSQTINLKEVFGHNFSGREALKEAIGQAFIDRIVARSKDGRGVSGRKLKSPYSKEYADSLDFKAAGKSRNNVNMTLTGDMLRSIDIIDQTANTITIGIDDPDEAPKAYNHQVGDTVPRREFFGLNQKDVNEIARDFRAELRDAFSKRGENRTSALESFILGVLRQTDETDGEG